MAVIEIVGAHDSIALRDDFLHLVGGSGWGKAPVGNQWVEGAADGRKFRGQRVLARTLVIPAVVFGGDEFSLNDRVRRLASIVSGEFLLRYTLSDGGVFTIPAVYESGLEGSNKYGVQAAKFQALTVSCPDPFWTSGERKDLSWVFAAGEPFLLNRKLSSAALSGDRQVVNAGDVESRPSWVFEGPFTNLEVAINGEGFRFTESMLAGEILFVEHDGWSWIVKDGAGVNRYAGVEWGPRFASLPPGSSTVSLDLSGADTGTRVSLFWAERREVMF